MVTLTGAGGSGKTRLAIEAAGRLVDDFRDGVYLVDLSPYGTRLVPSAIADVLAIKDATELEERIRGRRLLLVLDNFEHLLDAAPVVTSLASAEPDVALLVTSRVPLRLRGERRYRVDPLAVDEAAALFLQRAREVNPRFADGAPLRRICERWTGFRSRWSSRRHGLVGRRQRDSPTGSRLNCPSSPAGGMHRRGSAR